MAQTVAKRFAACWTWATRPESSVRKPEWIGCRKLLGLSSCFSTHLPECHALRQKPRAKNQSLSPQALLIDADDTLWQNNIYFERAIARFISFLNHHEFSPEQVREVLNDVERECIVTHGYGLHSFEHALVRTFERLSEQPGTSELHSQIRSFAAAIENHPIEFISEVRETLEYLSGRHRLILVTKGHVP